MKAVTAFFGPYIGWVKIAVGLFVLLKLWPLLSGIFGAFSKPLVDITTQLGQQAEESTDKALVKKVYPAATADDIAVFKEDASTIALALGYMPGSWSNTIIADGQTAFSTAKKYSRYLMIGSTVRKDAAGKWIVRKAELRLPVIAGLYAEITGGRTLVPDLTRAFDGMLSSEYSELFIKYIK